MAKNITEEVTESITLDNQLISVVEDRGFLWHLEFLNPWYAIPSQITLHYIESTFELQCSGLCSSFEGLIQQGK